jgi:putative methionine-R-sulfoxide reductase with GAF domain
VNAPIDSEEKLRRLQAVTDAALSRLGVEDLLNELLVRIRDLLQADTAGVMLLDASGAELIATAASGLEREVFQGVRVPVGRGFAGTVAATAEPLAIEYVDHANVLSPVLLGEHIASVLGVPMIVAGRVIGVLHIGARVPRRFTDDDVELLQLVADRAAHGTQARLHSLDRAVAYTLQRSLLPARPPRIPGLELAVRYVPGAEAGVGGDWYDVFDLQSGHIGLVIGDVAGNGLRAAVVMGRIRSALRAYAMESDDPADVLTRLDRKVQRFEPDAMATVMYAVINPALDTVTVANAGHLPPVVTGPGAPGRLAVVRPDLPIGAYPEVLRHTTDLPLPEGSGLFFYTDGLVERRDRPIGTGLQLLADTVRAGPPDTVCATAMAVMLEDRAPSDDVAVLALCRVSAL